MPPLKNKGTVGRPRKLDDPAIRTKLLVSLARGMTRTEACQEAGITMNTLRLAEKADPEFAEQILDAEEAAFDPAEHQLRDMASAGDISAIKEYRTLKRRREVREARERKLEIESRHVHVMEVEDEIRTLIGVLRERQRNELYPPREHLERVKLNRETKDDIEVES